METKKKVILICIAITVVLLLVTGIFFAGFFTHRAAAPDGLTLDEIAQMGYEQGAYYRAHIAYLAAQLDARMDAADAAYLKATIERLLQAIAELQQQNQSAQVVGA